MEKWQIDYWTPNTGKSPIERWLDKLTHEQFKSVTKVIKMLEKDGNKLGMPYSFPLGRGLFELRELSYGYRLYYCFQNDLLVIVLAAGNKRSQKHDIQIARKRLLQL